jgi:ribose-phosphate pyrophosphokinase
VDNVYATPVLLAYIRQQVHDGEALTVVSPDAGGVERPRLRERLNANLPSSTSVASPPKGRRNEDHRRGDGQVAVIIDDIVDTAGTIVAAADALRAAGAKEVIACCTHPVLSGRALEHQGSSLKRLVVTDTIPLREEVHALPDVVVLGGPSDRRGHSSHSQRRIDQLAVHLTRARR